MGTSHNPFYREMAELKSALLAAITPENAIALCRQLQRDCLNGSHADRQKAWNRFFRLLSILGLNTVNPDRVVADEAATFRANPSSLVEKMMRGQSITPPMSPNNNKPGLERTGI